MIFTTNDDLIVEIGYDTIATILQGFLNESLVSVPARIPSEFFEDFDSSTKRVYLRETRILRVFKKQGDPKNQFSVFWDFLGGDVPVTVVIDDNQIKISSSFLPAGVLPSIPFQLPVVGDSIRLRSPEIFTKEKGVLIVASVEETLARNPDSISEIINSTSKTSIALSKRLLVDLVHSKFDTIRDNLRNGVRFQDGSFIRLDGDIFLNAKWFSDMQFESDWRDINEVASTYPNHMIWFWTRAYSRGQGIYAFVSIDIIKTDNSFTPDVTIWEIGARNDFENLAAIPVNLDIHVPQAADLIGFNFDSFLPSTGVFSSFRLNPITVAPADTTGVLLETFWGPQPIVNIIPIGNVFKRINNNENSISYIQRFADLGLPRGKYERLRQSLSGGTVVLNEPLQSFAVTKKFTQGDPCDETQNTSLVINSKGSIPLPGSEAMFDFDVTYRTHNWYPTGLLNVTVRYLGVRNEDHIIVHSPYRITTQVKIATSAILRISNANQSALVAPIGYQIFTSLYEDYTGEHYTFLRSIPPNSTRFNSVNVNLTDSNGNPLNMKVKIIGTDRYGQCVVYTTTLLGMESTKESQLVERIKTVPPFLRRFILKDIVTFPPSLAFYEEVNKLRNKSLDIEIASTKQIKSKNVKPKNIIEQLFSALSLKALKGNSKINKAVSAKGK